MAQYKDGVVAVTNGDATVTGTGTAFLANVAIGDMFTIKDSGVTYQVGYVTDDTHLELTAKYAGTDLAGLSYVIHTSFTSPDSIPYLEPNDVESHTISKRGINKIQDLIVELRSGPDPTGTNDIGIAGTQGFGVGICPGPLPAGMAAMTGTTDPASDNYGNYQFTDGSVMVWLPAFYYKMGTGSNGVAINDVDIQPFSAYADVATANAAGYALHRAFYDGGAVQYGVFVDKYLCSNNSGTASSIKNGNPLSSNAVHNPFSGLTGAPANTYAGAIAAAKTRGASFFCNSLFVFKALALLSLAHANAATAHTWCDWYDSAGIENFPKGCNNNALGDAQDPSILYLSDGYSTAAKTGSANLFARTTHNGQNCGVADLNGVMWEISPGLTMNNSDPALGNFYVLKTAARMKDVTGGNTLATDLWGATGIAALYDDLGLMNSFAGYAVNFSDRLIYMGSASQVLSHATSGTAWKMTGAGIALVAGGSNQFGSDGIWDYSTNELCPIAGGDWANSSNAGLWALHLSGARSDSNNTVGFRAALYL